MERMKQRSSLTDVDARAHARQGPKATTTKSSSPKKKPEDNTTSNLPASFQPHRHPAAPARQPPTATAAPAPADPPYPPQQAKPPPQPLQPPPNQKTSSSPTSTSATVRRTGSVSLMQRRGRQSRGEELLWLLPLRRGSWQGVGGVRRQQGMGMARRRWGRMGVGVGAGRGAGRIRLLLRRGRVVVVLERRRRMGTLILEISEREGATCVHQERGKYKWTKSIIIGDGALSGW